MSVLDVLPARVVVTQDGTETIYERGRVYVQGGRAVLFVKSHLGAIEVARDETGATHSATGRKVWTVTTPDSTWAVTKSGGCACGDSLRAVKPARFLASMVDA